MTTSNFLFRYLLPSGLFVLLLVNMSVNASDRMSDKQLLIQMQKTAERLLDYKFIKCKYEIKTGLAESLEVAVKFGPQDKVQSAEVIWLYDGVRELIFPKVKYLEDRSDNGCANLSICDDAIYLADDKYILVVDKNSTPDGTVSLRSEPRYHVKHYNKETPLTEYDIPRVIEDEYLSDERLVDIAESYECDRIDIDVKLENDNLTLVSSTVSGNEKTPLYTFILNYKTIFPFTFNSGTTAKPLPPSEYVTDYYTTKDGRVFPKRIVSVVPCGFGRVPAKEWNLKDNEPVFVRELVVTYLETDVPPSEDEFVIELPEPTGIGDGVEHEKGETRIFAGLHPDFGLKITLADLPRLLNANREAAAERDHVPEVSYSKTFDIIVRVLFFVCGIVLIIIGIYGSGRRRNNMN